MFLAIKRKGATNVIKKEEVKYYEQAKGLKDNIQKEMSDIKKEFQDELEIKKADIESDLEAQGQEYVKKLEKLLEDFADVANSFLMRSVEEGIELMHKQAEESIEGHKKQLVKNMVVIFQELSLSEKFIDFIRDDFYERYTKNREEYTLNRQVHEDHIILEFDSDHDVYVFDTRDLLNEVMGKISQHYAEVSF